jgi:S-DNA-T family DNA segregation ATPase FtsK/SpoIIIE
MKARERQVDALRIGYVQIGEGEYQLPPVNILDYDQNKAAAIDHTAMLELSQRLTQTLENYGVKGEVTAIRPGPVVTMYEFAPAPGTRLSKIEGLADELAMVLEALRVRIVAPIPGKAVVGIEVPNRHREQVFLKEIVADEVFHSSKQKLPLALGKNIEGAPVVVDLAKMPHLLVAGTTGSGKSVSINSMITSLLYNCTPDDVRMIMVDPKMLELSIYEGIPHLLLPVVTDPKKANLALRWAVEEMERRYQLLSEVQARDIASYNRKVGKLKAMQEAERLRWAAFDVANEDELNEADDPGPEAGTGPVSLGRKLALEEPRKLPYIVVIIDEFADLMMQSPKDVENSVARIAQKARAAGIHLILATQRPSTNVITGLIKANFPSRIAFHVVTKVDSRVVLDQHGAEALLGAGDMLFSDRGAAPRRFHGCFIGEEEVQRVVEFLKQQGRPVYNLDILQPRDSDEGEDEWEGDEIADEKYDQAVHIVAQTRKATISYLQRRLGVGYNKAAKMIERMEKEGIVSAPDAKKIREVLIPPAA